MMRFRDSYKSISLSQKVSSLSPIDEPKIRSRALLSVGHSNLLVGNSALAEQALSEASALCLLNEQLPAYLSATDFLSQLRIFQGRLREARALYAEAKRTISETTEPIYSGIELIGLGNLYREYNHLAEARRYIEKGIELAEKGGDFVFIYDGYMAQSKLEHSCGNTESALNALQKAKRLLHTGQMKSALIPLEALSAKFLLSEGKLIAVEPWFNDFSSKASDRLNYLNSTSFIVYIQILIAKGQVEQALDLIKRLRSESETAGWAGLLIELLILNTLALNLKGNAEEALSLLQKALVLAEPENYIRIFVDFGEPVKEALIKLRLLYKTTKSNYPNPQLAVYINKIFEAFRKNKNAPYSKGAQSNESTKVSNQILTKRELEILALVDEGFPNHDIAKHFVLSEGTVKRHMHNICSKLNARNRNEALARAKKLVQNHGTF